MLQNKKNILEVFCNRRMVLMLLMGFSSGLPLALTGGTLQAWMKDENVDLTVIGAFSLVGLPYTLKFIWSPLIDRYVPPFLGRRRGWMIITQFFLIVALLLMSSFEPSSQMTAVAVLSLVISFFSASQDIVIDAYRTEILLEEERGAGASVSNLGYRLAMITSGAIALVLADILPWQQVYQIMAALVGIGILATIFGEEPLIQKIPQTIKEAVFDPFLEFFKRKGIAEILSFIVLYKIDIVMAVALTTPFMMELGFSKTEIGAVTKGVGMIAAICGSLVGGAAFTKLGMKKSLLYFGIIQGISTLSFAVLASVGKNSLVMATTVGFENFCAGLATAPFIAFLMSLCDRRFTATHYALLSSLAALSRVFAGAPTGYLAKELGWVNFFIFCAITSIPALLLLIYRFDYMHNKTKNF